MRSIIKCPYYYFNKAIPDEMCNLIVEVGKTKQRKEATLNSDGTIDNTFRKGDIRWMNESWVQEILWTYLSTANKNANWNFLIDDKEDVQFATYELGAFYNWHRDSDIKMKRYRKLSISVQLAEPNEYEGGELHMKHIWGEKELPMDLELKNKGSIVVFPSCLLHRVTPVTKGIRYSLVQWFSGPDFV